MDIFGKQTLKKTHKTFKSLFNEDKDQAMYTVRQILSGLGFYASDDSLINIKIIKNQLFILSFCPELNLTVPNKFMYDNIKDKRISTPTLFTLNKPLVNITSYMVKINNKMNEIESLEIPFKLIGYELAQNLIFGEYKAYHNFFIADKISGNNNVPDELEPLLLLSMIKNQVPQNDLNNSNISKYRKKIVLDWSNNSLLLTDSFFKHKDTIFESGIASLIKIAEENSAIKKAS